MFKFVTVFVALLACTSTQTPGSHSLCPEPNGRFPDREQCDAFTECIDGVPEHKLCPDGMVLTDHSEKGWDCALIPPHLACGNRTKLQPAQPTEDCPHQFGLYRIGDASHCGQYKNCANGEASINNCTLGLAFNSETWRCDWPDEVADCDPEAYLQFRCPGIERKVRINPEVDGDDILFHPYEHDCRYYFACVNNKPRLQTCGYCKCYVDLLATGVGLVQEDFPVNENAPAVKGFSVDEVLNIQLPRRNL